MHGRLERRCQLCAVARSRSDSSPACGSPRGATSDSPIRHTSTESTPDAHSHVANSPSKALSPVCHHLRLQRRCKSCAANTEGQTGLSLPTPTPTSARRTVTVPPTVAPHAAESTAQQRDTARQVDLSPASPTSPAPAQDRAVQINVRQVSSANPAQRTSALPSAVDEPDVARLCVHGRLFRWC